MSTAARARAGARARRAGRPAPPASRPRSARRASSLSPCSDAERERDAEQALDHALVDLAREVDARLEQARAALLVGGDADARGERRRLPDRPHRAALVVVQLERLAAAVGEDHAQPAPAGRHGRARERGELGEVRVARRHPASRSSETCTTRSWESASLGDRRLLEAAVRRPRAAPPRARGCPPAPRAGGPRRRAAGRRASSTPGGRAPRRGGRRSRGRRVAGARRARRSARR